MTRSRRLSLSGTDLLLHEMTLSHEGRRLSLSGTDLLSHEMTL